MIGKGKIYVNLVSCNTRFVLSNRICQTVQIVLFPFIRSWCCMVNSSIIIGSNDGLCLYYRIWFSTRDSSRTAIMSVLTSHFCSRLVTQKCIIRLDIRLSRLDIRLSRLDIRMSKLNIQVGHTYVQPYRSTVSLDIRMSNLCIELGHTYVQPML